MHSTLSVDGAIRSTTMLSEAEDPLPEPPTATDESVRANEAVQEADAVLEAVGGDSHLDGFNLLGVIANPRGASLAPSFQGRYNHGATAATTSSSLFADSSMLSATFYTIESTIHQATEQMEYMNAVLEDWSRQILEEPYATDEAEPESMLTELPLELQNLDTAPVQRYLASSGDAAASFRHRIPGTQLERTMSLSSSGDPGTQSPATDDIPPVFYRSDFDLTEPETFRELLLIDHEQSSDMLTASLQSGGSSEDSSSDAFDPNCPSVHDWFLLQPPEAFAACLDKVELSLLHQVRSKSAAFFEESLRFAQLQEGIQVLMHQVKELTRTALFLQQDLLEPMEIVPAADTQRTDLQRLLVLLDRANELLICKSSIGGFLSAQDDSTAIEQIQYARRLLAGDIDEATETVELHRLQAFKAVAGQLQQFEQLVTTNLRDEVVEIFLDWNTSSVTRMYSLHQGASVSKSTQEVQQRVREIMGSLEKCNGLLDVRTAYSNRLEDIIRMTVRTTVGEFTEDSNGSTSSTSAGVTGMTLERFVDCLDMLFESLLALLGATSGVNEFCLAEGFRFNKSEEGESSADCWDESEEDPESTSKKPVGPMTPVLSSAAELASKSISELLRLRKEAHSLVALEDMKKIWDRCIHFAVQIETMSGHSASNLRSTLLAQAKAFVERKHESNMSALAAALDSERWTQWDVKSERQVAINRLCHGRSVIISPTDDDSPADAQDKNPHVEVDGRSYKVVWSCLLLIEMIVNDIAASTYFPSLTSNIVAKASELLRLFNSRSTQLVLGAGAIHSAARLKSINAKHLSMVAQCLGIVMALIPHIRSALRAHLPSKQHMLLSSFDQIKKEYAEHNEKVLNKFVTIIGGIVEHGLAPKIPGIDFDERARSYPASTEGSIACCIFFEGVSTNARKMHQVLASLLPPDHIQVVFSRIFAFLDQKIPSLFIAASERNGNRKAGETPRDPVAVFKFPTTDDGKKQMLLEAEDMTKSLNALSGVYPWDFTLVSVLGKHVLYDLHPGLPVTPMSTGLPVTPMSTEEIQPMNGTADVESDEQVSSEKSIQKEIDEADQRLNAATESGNRETSIDEADQTQESQADSDTNNAQQHALGDGEVVSLTYCESSKPDKAHENNNDIDQLEPVESSDGAQPMKEEMTIETSD